MKTFIIMLLGLSALVSCKKKYVCECITTKNPENSSGEVAFNTYPTTNTRTIKARKEDAEASCKSGNKVAPEPGFYEPGEEPAILTTTCELR